MGFEIAGHQFSFKAYESLRSFEQTHPIVKDIISFLDRWYNDEVSDIVVHTSGSTGVPKSIKLAKTAMRASAIKTQHYFEYKEGDTALLSLPVKFIAGKMMLVRSLISELHLIIVDPTSNPLRNLDSNIDFLPITPHQFLEIYSVNPESFSKVKCILLGGAPVDPKLESKISKVPARVFHGFGMTETITHIAVREMKEGITLPYNTLDGIKVKSTDDSCLIINADHLKEEIVTNDIVELMSDTSFVWKGRKDNVINSGGIKLNPELLETKISSSINTRYFFAGMNDELLGERLVLVLEDERSRYNTEQLLATLTSILGKHEMPKAIFYLPNFIETENGKIKRSETLELAIKNN